MIIRKDIQQLLQECLDGFDAGLTPDECLSAYPRIRSELEPLFRQAISLRVAYAASPRPEFRFQAREKLMFAAGRDVTQALATDPDPAFVSTTRQRLLNRAGAGAQEALRDVPPPRLPFWANARRHLLETAATTPPKPAHRMPVGVRTALSAAVIVLAVAIAGGGFFLQDSPANRQSQPSLAAELNYISEQVQNYEQLKASGQAVSSSLLDDLATRTSKLAEQYSSDSPNADLIQKLPDLIQRQQTLLEQDGGLDETLAAAKERLDAADEKFTAASAPASPEPTATDEPVAIVPETPEPTTEPTATATVTVPDVEIVTSADLEPGQVVSQFDPNEITLGLRWWRVTTSSLTFVMPESWAITNLDTGDNGLATLTPPEVLIVQTDVAGVSLVISNETGKVDTVIDGEQHTLRASGDVDPMEPGDLLKLVNLDPNGASLYNMLASITLAGASQAPAATETPPASPSPSVTKTPEATTTDSDPATEGNP